MLKKYIMLLLLPSLFLAVTPVAVTASAAETGSIVPYSSGSRSVSKTIAGTTFTATIIYDLSTGKINRGEVTKSAAYPRHVFNYYITNNGYTCVFDIDIYTPNSITGWDPVINSPGPTR